MPNEFYNPYHFVPVSKNLRDTVAVESFKSDQCPAHLTHDQYVPGTLSGRLICRLKTVTPLVIGAQQTSGEGTRNPGTVAQFQLNGKAAVPASSLRGLISATAEAASNSALRILSADWDCHEDGFRESGGKSDSSAVKEFGRINRDLTPLGKDPGKTLLTLAELLFGFVEERERDIGNEQHALALASRLRFGHGESISKVKLEPSVTLKELSSPKPPRATFYFEPYGSTKLPAKDSVPKGRKFYVPHQEGSKDWTTQRTNGRDRERQLSVTPIAEGSIFWFYLDFDNLTDTELDLLCYSLCPNPGYLHRLGLGKPLGLGLVSIEAAGLFLIDRSARYRGPGQPNPERPWFQESRYHTGWTSDAVDLQRLQWPPRFEAEKKEGYSRCTEPVERAIRFKCGAPAEHGPIFQALEMLGNSSLVRHPVHYPATAAQGSNLEDKLYLWFSARPNEYLLSLPNGGTIPHLHRGSTGGGGRPGGGGSGGGVAPPTAKPTRPADLHNVKVKCTVVANDKNGVCFTIPCGTLNVAGLLEGAKDIPNAAIKFPLGWTGEMLALNPQKTKKGWQCQLRAT